MGAVGRMVSGGEVVQAIVNSAIPILRLDTVPLVALAVSGCCLLLLWVILRWRQEPQIPELSNGKERERFHCLPHMSHLPHTVRRPTAPHPGIAASATIFSPYDEAHERKS